MIEWPAVKLTLPTKSMLPGSDTLLLIASAAALRLMLSKPAADNEAAETSAMPAAKSGTGVPGLTTNGGWVALTMI